MKGFKHSRTEGMETGKFAAVLALLFFGGLVLPAQTPGNGETALKLAPAYPEMPVPFWELHHRAIIGLSALVLLSLGALIWLLLKPVPPEIVPPEVAARAALEKLSSQPEDGDCLSRLSQILRHYFITAFGIPAGELTTAEFCTAMDGRPEVGPDLAGHVAVFLRQCDGRKFEASPNTATFKAVDRALELIGLAEDRRNFLQTQIQSPAKRPAQP
jgi:hypothetical protein